ncbi:MAG: glycerate kinase [Candidatus Heimdallarchaeota archaeon]
MWITNCKEILAAAQNQKLKALRQIGLSLIDKMVSELQPEVLLKNSLHRVNNELLIGPSIINLSEFDEILVLGGGKAAIGLANALEAFFPDRPLRGLLTIPDGLTLEIDVSPEIILQKASHPIPDNRGLKATKKMVKLLKGAAERSLVLFLISGGGSALMPLPAGGISLKAKIEVNQLLLGSGADIHEINTVRKHLSAWKGGQAAKLAFPATLVSLILSDVIGDPLDVVASGPSIPDSSTFSDAHNILAKHNLWDNVDASVRKHIESGLDNKIPETPKFGDTIFQNTIVEVIGNNRTATNIIVNRGRELGYNTLVLTNALQGEAREVGKTIGAICLQLERFKEPISKPCIVLLGGETTVTVIGDGSGGRNQELALGCSGVISGLKKTCVFAFGTDGIDGSSDAAGAIVDGTTYQRFSIEEIDIEDVLRRNDSATAFKRLGDDIVTGYTGTNVADIILIISQD